MSNSAILKRIYDYLRKMSFLNLRWKMLFYFGLMFIGMLILLNWIELYGIPFTKLNGEYVEQQKEIFNNLNLVADLKKERLMRWLEERRDDAAVLSDSSILKSSLMSLKVAIQNDVAHGTKGDTLWKRIEEKKVYKDLVQHLTLAQTVYGVYEAIQIADSETGTLIASTRSNDLGLNFTGTDYFTKPLLYGDTYINIHKIPDKREFLLYISRSIWDEKGVFAILIMMVNPGDIIKPMLHTGQGLGRTGEALLISENVKILTFLKHPLQDGSIAQPLEYQIKAEPARLAARGEEGITVNKDYRGVPVLAAYRHIRISSDLGWGMVVKRDREEVFAPLQRHISYSFIIGVVGLGAMFGLTILIAKKLTRPIQILSRTARQAEEGDLKVQAQIKTSDEIGQLGKTFDSMVLRLNEWHGELEDKVRTRTAQLDKSNENLKKEIIERQLGEKKLQASNSFLEIANRHTQLIPLLKEFVTEIKSFTACDAVGIRIVDEEGNIPFTVYDGYDQRFYESESQLSIKSDQCMCINIVKGNADPELPFYTEGGSFFMNRTTHFLSTVSEEDKGQTRNVCNAFGYESCALFPIRLGDSILGLVHLADQQENKVPLEMVTVLEMAGKQLGPAIQRVRAEEALRKAHNELEQRVEERTAELVRTNEKLNREIEERKLVEKKLMANQEQLRMLSSELSLTEERERRHFSEVLHDGIGQNLALSLNSLNALLDSTSSADLRERVNKITKLLKETIHGTRTLTMELSPPILYDFGFEAAVEVLAEEFQEQHSLEVEMDMDDTLKSTDVDLDAILFRTTRELLINVVKHAKVSKARVSIRRNSDEIMVTVEDNGIGFDTTKVDSWINTEKRSFGLLSIRERIRHLGGSFEIESKPGTGTKINLVAPLNLKGATHKEEA